mgnify:CR=1 FL=1|jgi:iron complex transport system ATP-binding protein
MVGLVSRPAILLQGACAALGRGEERFELVDIGLELGAGAMMALVGPNGAGKSTLLGLISGVIRPSSGRVHVCGLDPQLCQPRQLARRMAVVSEQPRLGFPFTVLEVVLMGRAPHVEGFRLETEADLEVAQKAMEDTEVSHLAGRVFDTLSSGERQRVIVARALAQEPQLLLLDEPAAFLDIKQETRLYDLLEELNGREGLTVVSVLHDLNLAAMYFEQVALLKGGRLVAVGSPEEVITYASIREVFETDVYVDRNHLTGRLNVAPLPGRIRMELAERG